MKLDKSKPYGSVSGLDAARFEQGGRMFDANGDEIAAVVEQPDAAVIPAAAPVEDAEKPAEKKKPGRKPKAIDTVAADSPPVIPAAAPTAEDESTPIDAQIAAQSV